MKTLLIPLDTNATKPLYLQVADYITEAARNGQLQSGQQLPPSRTLADQNSVHRSTIINAYQELKARGVLASKPGSGSYIEKGLSESSSLVQKMPAQDTIQTDELIAEIRRMHWSEGMISLGYGPPADELMPVEDFDRSRQRVLRRDGKKTANYEHPQGYYPLRQAICADLVKQGIQADPNDVLITNGVLEGVSLISRALAAPGDSVLTELPQYFGNWTNFSYLGLNVRGFDLLESGPDFASLEAQLQDANDRLRFVFVTADHQNPLGTCWTMPARHEFLKMMNKYDIPVVEDATYRDLTYDGMPHTPLRALDPDVIYVGTFSHSLMPGLRIGFVLCHGRLREHIERLKAISSGPVETLNQRALADFLSTGEYERHLERIIPVYRSRRDALLNAMQTHFPADLRWTKPSGGFFVWVWLPERISAIDLFYRSLKKGISIAPANIFYPGPCPQNAFRLAFSHHSEDVLTRAVMEIGQLL
ncbi:MAG: PLP-dependent aminotransferase family protein [Anaerolineales bacterium]|uniref:aminotransferase-like domain-containing protein n=1 Tax=Candidatus Villigracilis vicinus TaxID=3140679 RepID=UPI003135FADD|nr:PLP-dependent aminotransferase family protein [Anaerolineales bacterium]MBK9780928.1 PLP-dependent aminotransferase family protein [Anaerolineales bacterium]